jgi:hypothetical protein
VLSAPFPGEANAAVSVNGAYFVLHEGNYSAAVARLLADGSVDKAFGIVSFSDDLNVIAADGQGAIVAGTTSIGSRPALTFSRVR